jgi:site-specific recombinase XerD
MNTTEMQVIPPDPLPKLKKIMSMRDLWDVWVGTKGDIAPYTKVEYRGIGNKFCTFMENHPMEPMSMVEFVQEWRKTAGNNKVNGYMVRVKGFLKFLKKMHYINDDLWEAVPLLPKEATAPVQIFTDEDYKKIKTYCTDREWTQPHLWLFILAYHTGMSLIDCAHLRWRDVHLNENGPSFIDIHRIKTKRLGEKALCQIPVIPFTDVHEWLMKLKKVEHLNYKRFDGITDFVHQDCPGLYACTFQHFRGDFKNICKRCGVDPKKTFRFLRNTFCSNLVNSGTQLALICKMTGHNNVATLLRYLKPDRRSLQEGLEKALQYAQEKS